MAVVIRPISAGEWPWLAATMTDTGWGLPVVSPSGCYDLLSLPCLVAVDGDELVGAVTYRESSGDIEIVVLVATVRRRGMGTALLAAVRERARPAGVRVWLITTDDNTAAIRFYEARGMHVARVHERFVDVVRGLKPTAELTFTDAIEYSD